MKDKRKLKWGIQPITISDLTWTGREGGGGCKYHFKVEGHEV